MAELPVSQNMGESLLVRQESCLSFSIKAGGEGATLDIVIQAIPYHEELRRARATPSREV